jgi:hypothetical protein
MASFSLLLDKISKDVFEEYVQGTGATNICLQSSHLIAALFCDNLSNLRFAARAYKFKKTYLVFSILLPPTHPTEPSKHKRLFQHVSDSSLP